DKGDHWLINGSKTWISNAAVADVLICYAYTDKDRRATIISIISPVPGRNIIISPACVPY
ncbi:MAG: acyl-CoA dehydrogenase family protein, partial [Candidatus Fermentibacteria bacterium]